MAYDDTRPEDRREGMGLGWSGGYPGSRAFERHEDRFAGYGWSGEPTVARAYPERRDTLVLRAFGGPAGPA